MVEMEGNIVATYETQLDHGCRGIAEIRDAYYRNDPPEVLARRIDLMTRISGKIFYDAEVERLLAKKTPESAVTLSGIKGHSESAVTLSGNKGD